MYIHASFVNILLAGMTITLSACAIGPELDLSIHDSEHGAVYLERIPDRSFQAAHPMTFSTETMARVLRGVLVRDNQGLLQNLIAGKSEAVRAFGDEDVTYLAPLLVDGLTKAASDQQVAFRLATGASPNSPAVGSGAESPKESIQNTPKETTSGALYAYGRSLYLTITEYRRHRDGAGVQAMATRGLPDSTGLANKTVEFTPESAKRPNSYRHSRSLPSTLAIDYDVLAGMPATQEVRPAAVLPPPVPAMGEPVQRDKELDALRKELQDIKRKLAEKEAERTRSTLPTGPTP